MSDPKRETQLVCPGPMMCMSEAARLDALLFWYRHGGARMRLAEHWLYQMECRHEKRQDIAHCACGWTSNPMESVGVAANEWARHAINLLWKAEP